MVRDFSMVASSSIRGDGNIAAAGAYLANLRLREHGGRAAVGRRQHEHAERGGMREVGSEDVRRRWERGEEKGRVRPRDRLGRPFPSFSRLPITAAKNEVALPAREPAGWVVAASGAEPIVRGDLARLPCGHVNAVAAVAAVAAVTAVATVTTVTAASVTARLKWADETRERRVCCKAVLARQVG